MAKEEPLSQSLSRTFGVSVGDLERQRQEKVASRSKILNTPTSLLPDYTKVFDQQFKMAEYGQKQNQYASALASMTQNAGLLANNAINSGMQGGVDALQSMGQNALFGPPSSSYFSPIFGMVSNSTQNDSESFGGEDMPMSASSLKLKYANEDLAKLNMEQAASSRLDASNAQNSAQSSKERMGDLEGAYNSVQELYSSRGGRPIAGSEDIRVKSDAYGRPYTVVNVSARDSGGGEYREESGFGLTKR
jgi:hypothetical protein